MIGAIEKHGLKGVLMGIARILRCHPFVTGGDDPVPDYFTLRRNKRFSHKERGKAKAFLFSLFNILTKFLE